MNKYRILKEIDGHGTPRFFIQQRIFVFFWIKRSYITSSSTYIWYPTIEDAREEMNRFIMCEEEKNREKREIKLIRKKNRVISREVIK